MTKKDRTKKTYSMFASFIMCCLGASLMTAALATQYWFKSNCHSGADRSSGYINFGLFRGSRLLDNGLSQNFDDLKIVCSDGDCMFSCGTTKDYRQEQLEAVRNGDARNFSTVVKCDGRSSSNPSLRAFVLPLSTSNLEGKLEQNRPPPHVPLGYGSLKSLFRYMSGGVYKDEDTEGGNGGESGEVETYGNNLENEDDLLAVGSSTTLDPTSTTIGDKGSSTTLDPTSTTIVPHEDPEFMSYGLWVGTISCLVIGMVFAVVGALFAVINTATTPVETITGVPGLYIWNSMAALFNLICVILWAVQFHQHLSKNVLLYDADNGWTTEGMEVFGYSFWLVVVAIIVHVGNIVIIFVGTYERKIKEQVEKPEEKSVNLMLY